MEKWFIKNSKPENINLEKYNLNKVLYKVLVNRNIINEKEIEDYLNPSLDKMNSAILLPDLIKVSNYIFKAIDENKKIRIVGDYDVDGVMSTYILYRGLNRINANVDYTIPHRVKDGYGINKDIIKRAEEDNIDIIITCDNGIAASEAVDYANDLGIEVIITDHHEVPLNESGNPVIPKARAVINPKKEGSKYPFMEICGAVVAYKLISYLYIIKGISEDELYDYLLPYAAMATICDVMPLTNENRIIVAEGLKRLNNSKDIGLRTLIKESGLEGKNIDVYHIGFIIGPTVNSAGRLESADYALKLFLEDNEENAIKRAKYLRELNLERQMLTDEGFNRIDEIITKNQLTDKYSVLIVADKSLNESVVGIIAGRIKDKYNRPTVILTESKGLLKGSGRSIENYNMFKRISEHKHYLDKFGGHAMACGLSLTEENLNAFIKAVNKDSNLTEEDLIKKVYIDMGIKLSNSDINLVEQLEMFAPYGTCNPKALFGTRNLKILRFSVFGKNKNVIKLILGDGVTSREAILFEYIDDFINKLYENYSMEEINLMMRNLENNIFIDIVYTPTINDFRGNRTLELLIKNYRCSEVSKC